eukprot:32360_1
MLVALRSSTLLYVLCTLAIIFCLIDPSFAEHPVCNTCQSPTECPSDIAGIEECIELGGENRCYWKDKNIIDVGSYKRTCISDNECFEFDDATEFKSCLRCCDNAALSMKLCTETISTLQEPCGIPGIASQTAPCCAGQSCINNVFGFCAVRVDECETCSSFAMMINLGEVISGDNCIEGFCLTDRSSVISVNISGTQGQIFYDGVCIPEDGKSKTVSECNVDANCPSCMRCCSNKCVRPSGEICGYKFSGHGPCCCPEDECKLDECIINTESPTQTPSQTPITQKPITEKPITQKPTAPTSASPTKDD